MLQSMLSHGIRLLIRAMPTLFDTLIHFGGSKTRSTGVTDWTQRCCFRVRSQDRGSKAGETRG